MFTLPLGSDWPVTNPERDSLRRFTLERREDMSLPPCLSVNLWLQRPPRQGSSRAGEQPELAAYVTSIHLSTYGHLHIFHGRFLCSAGTSGQESCVPTSPRQHPAGWKAEQDFLLLMLRQSDKSKK